MKKIFFGHFFVFVVLFGIQYSLLTVFAATDIEIQDIAVKVVNTNVTFSWRTNTPTRARVDIGLGLPYNFFRDTGLARTLDHELSIDGLESEKTYHYKITVTGEDGVVVQTFDQTFKTGKQLRSDFDAPEIGNVDLIYYTDREAFITWTTEESAEGWVEYGVAPNLNKKASHNGKSTYHEVKLSGLAPGTLYTYAAISKDKDGNRSESAVMQIRTLISAGTRNDPLEIVGLRPIATNDKGLKATSSVVSWRTNKPSTGLVEWGISTKYGQKLSHNDKRYDHEFWLHGLTPDTVYHFRVSGKDIYGKSVLSGDRILQTLGTGSTRGGLTPATPARFTPVSALYKTSNDVRVYAIMSGKKYWLRSPQAMQRFGVSWKDVTIVPPALLAPYPDVRLFRSPEDSRIYFLYTRIGRKKLLANTEVFESYRNNSFDDVIVIPPEELMAYHDVEVVKTSDAAGIYLLTPQGTRRPFVSSESFLSRGYRWSDVAVVSPKDLESYVLGEAVQ